MTEEKPVLLTVPEACKILRIRRAKMYVMIEAGVIDAIKIGNDWRIKTDSLEQQIGGFPENFWKVDSLVEAAEG